MSYKCKLDHIAGSTDDYEIECVGNRYAAITEWPSGEGFTAAVINDSGVEQSIDIDFAEFELIKALVDDLFHGYEV